MKKLTLLILLFVLAGRSMAQMPTDITAALQNDDATELGKLISKDNVNACYGYYSLLSESIREDAPKCFDLLIKTGADVNKSCNGYVPPLMHAVKYGQLEMVKTLIVQGADKNYKYNGDLKMENGPEKGDTPFTYATKYDRDDILSYLSSLK